VLSTDENISAIVTNKSQFQCRNREHHYNEKCDLCYENSCKI